MAKDMTMTSDFSATADHSRESSSFLVWLEQIAQKVAATAAWYRYYNETSHELKRLSERELNDIGIARCDIPVIAMEAANDKQRIR